MAMQPANVQTYVDEWVKVASGGNITTTYAWHPAANRIQLRCSVCDHSLTCAIPETPEKIDYALQKFVGLHRHAAFVPPKQTSNIKYYNKRFRASWNYVPYTAPAKKQNRATLKDEEGRRFRE